MEETRGRYEVQFEPIGFGEGWMTYAALHGATQEEAREIAEKILALDFVAFTRVVHLGESEVWASP
jgi:hypothetical protein